LGISKDTLPVKVLLRQFIPKSLLLVHPAGRNCLVKKIKSSIVVVVVGGGGGCMAYLL